MKTKFKLPIEYWFVVFSGIISGTIVFSGQIFANLGLSLFEISVLPYLFTVIFLGPLVWFNRNYRYKKGLLGSLILYGLISAVITISQFGGVVLGVPVAIVVLLLYTQPFWTLIFSKIFLHEKIAFREVLACIIVLIGIVILVNPFGDVQIKSWPGFFIALTGGIALSGWISAGSYLSKRGSHPISSMFFGNLFMLITFAITLPILARLVHNPSITNFSFILPLSIWFYLFVFWLVTKIINHWLFLRGVEKVKTLDSGIIMLLEPLSGAFLAAIFLHQPITIYIIIGGVLILWANYLILSGSYREARN